jgi:hypothetical protein
MGIGLALSALGRLLGGIPGILGDVAERLALKGGQSFVQRAGQFAAQAVADAVFAAGQGFSVVGWTILTVKDGISAINIWDWCTMNKGACKQEPNGGMPE